MAMGWANAVQGDNCVTWAEMPRVFCERLQKLLSEAGLDAFTDETCKSYYAPKLAASSLPSGRFFRYLACNSSTPFGGSKLEAG